MWFRQFYIVFFIWNLQTVKIKCENGISITFAIDNTRSMEAVLDDVKKHAESILNVALAKKSNDIKDFVLVAINDPDVKLIKKTRSKQVFLEELEKLYVYRDVRNNECEEMSLSGIGNATEDSEFGSYIFVFTDAAAKDYDKVDKIKHLCQKKQIQVIFILTGDCQQSSSKGYSVYYEIAQATSGQVFRVKINEVNGVLNVIHDLLQDKKAVIAWKILNPSHNYQKVEFEIDEKSTSVMVSSSSWDLDLHITNTPSLLFGEKEAIHNITWTSNAKVGKLVHPKPGKYYAWVRGSSLISFVVYVSKQFAFEHGYSTEETAQSLEYTSKQPFDNSVAPEIVSFSTSETDNNFTAICRVKGIPKPVISWHFKPRGSVAYRLIPGSGEELNIPIARRGHAGVYKCVARNILGENHRIIDVVILEVPVIMNEINKFIALKGDAVLRIPCKVTGWPDPRVVWKKDGLIIENSSKYEVKENILLVKNLMETDTANYTCEALNVLGTAHKTSEIVVIDAFKYNNDTLYGHTHTIFAITQSPVTMKCKVMSSDMLQTRWYLNGQYTNYTGSTYNIEKATKEDNGIYTCRVNSNEGSSSQSFDLQVGSPPHFVYESWSVDADIEDVLDCTVTFDPEVEVQWLHNGVLMSTGIYTQEFVAHEWGEYKCIASNKYGSIERTYKIESTDCYVNKHMVTQNMPLWFYDKKVWPKLSYNVGIILAASESIVLVCPSPNTFQEFPTKNNITAECYKKDQFIVDGKTYKFSTLQCKEKIEPLIVNTNKECAGPHTEMIQIGFTVDSFMEAYKVCYDSKNNVPVFGSTQIVTNDISREEMLFKWSQTETVHETGELACRNFSNCCYSNRQLITAEQIVFGPPQAATFKNNLNSVPVWIPCREERMSWTKFEGYVQYNTLSINFKSWTGASYYINKNGGRIPKFLWKVINNKGEFTAAVYVNSMDPTTDDVLCSSSCESLRMLELKSKSAANSFYCCSLNEFSKAFNITYSFNNDAPFF